MQSLFRTSSFNLQQTLTEKKKQTRQTTPNLSLLTIKRTDPSDSCLESLFYSTSTRVAKNINLSTLHKALV